jgi:predicted Zn-dependent protease
MLGEDRARGAIDHVLVLARNAPKGAETIVAMSQSRAGNTRFAVGEITSSSEVERVALTVTIQLGKRSASVTTNQLDDRTLDDIVARTIHMAQLAPENPEQMPALARQKYLAVKGAVDPATVAMTPAGRAKAVGAVLAAGDKLGIAGFYSHGHAARSLATSAGLWAHREWTACGLSCTARTSDGTGSGWAGAGGHRVADLDAAALAKVAADKAVASAKPKKLDPGRYDVILEPAAVADLLSFLTGSLNARRADEGRSFFSKPGGATKIGDKLFPESITLRSDPTDAALAASPFDGEGVPLAPTAWIDKGVLTALATNRFWAHKQGKPLTGAPNGFTLAGGTATRDQLIKGIKRGVLITRMFYLRWLDPQAMLVTGLTRDGTFLIDNGAIAAPVNNFRFNESPIQMLAHCDGLGAAVITPGDEGPVMRVPMLRTHDFHLSSVSEAV